MKSMYIGIASVFLGVMAACAVDSDPSDRAGSSEHGPQITTSSSTEAAETATDVDALQAGPIRPHFCFQFYQGAGNYFQCSTTGAWFTNRSRCIDNCSGGSCTLDVICGPGGMCDCSPN